MKHQALVLGLLECASASRVIRRSTYLGDMVTLQTRAGTASTPPNGMGKDPMFKLNGELLHGGQGKDNKLINIDCNHNQPGGLNVQLCMTDGLEGLNPPWLEETGEVVLGDNKTQMQKENKRHRRQLKAEQDKVSQWATHQGNSYETSAPQPHSTMEYRNSMCSRVRALAHLAVGLLTEWATMGCPTHMGQPWTKEEIWEAVARGPHQSTLSPEAIAPFLAEAAEQFCTNQAHIVAWDDIKDNLPQQLKILPIVAILHKSKAFRSILDLLFCLCLHNGGVRAAINDTTEKNSTKGRN